MPEDADGTDIAPDGRVMEMLSEHTLEGWLEGYLLTGRHGSAHTYEAFVHVIDSMFNQHAKWLEKSKTELDWRAPISSLNLLITSLVWRQDHNGFSHQDPGFLDVVSQQERRGYAHLSAARRQLPAERGRPLPAQRGLRQRHRRRQAAAPASISTWTRPSSTAPRASASGTGPATMTASSRTSSWPAPATSRRMEALAAVAILREHFPDLKIRFVNVVDLFRLQPDCEHPHGLSDRDFDSLFTRDKPVIFNFHGYPLADSQAHLPARPITTTSTCAATRRRATSTRRWNWRSATRSTASTWPSTSSTACRGCSSTGAHLKEWLKDQIIESINYAYAEGIDKPEIRNWTWPL